MWRKTPQTTLIISILEERGHATNQELLVAAHKDMPAMTATTVHRITARLVNAGMASYAPARNGVKVIDNNSKPHDHFVCRGCNRMIDISIDDEMLERLQQQLPGKLTRNSTVITGMCEACNK